MKRPSWIRSLSSHLTGRRRPARKPAPARLTLEPLEDRCVPAAMTFNVVNNNDAGTGSLRQAILDANANAGADTITFDAGMTGQTIALTTGALPTIADPLTITGLGQRSLTISGSGASRVFSIGANVPVTLTGLTVTGGAAGAGNSGGGILNNGNLTLTNVSVLGNTAPTFGGGLDSTGAGAKVTATNCIFANNTSGSEGGGFENDTTSTATLTGCTIAGNTAGTNANGAGIVNRGQMTLTSSLVSQNTGLGTNFFGGGIFSNGTLAVTMSTVANNTSQGSGGGIQSSGTLFTLTNSTIVNNLSLSGSGGGGLRVTSGPLTLLNSTITNNTDASGAATNAGGVSFVGTTLTMSNTIVAQNFATGAAAPPDIRGAVASGINNFVGIGDGTLTGIADTVNGNQIGTAAAPKDPQLGVLQNNGTPPLPANSTAPTGAAPLQTRAPRLGSPVINAGSNPAAVGLTTDERGFQRIIGGTVDIGAVEFQTPRTTIVLTVAPASPTPFRVPVTLTATVTPAASSAQPNNPVTGTVTFLLNGTTVLGTAPLDSTGKATLTLKPDQPLPAQTNKITARYDGDSNFTSSVSVAINQLVSVRKITPGVYDPGTSTWLERNTNSAGPADIPPFQFGTPGNGVFPVVGDWTGNGVFTPGIFIQATATFQIRLSNTAGPPDITFAFGPAGVGIPVAGDWTGTGKWGVGVFDPTKGNWNLRTTLTPGLPDAGSFLYGSPNSKPVVGDWNGDGKFTIGVVEPDGTWKLKNDNLTGPPDFQFAYGSFTDTPIAGDWSGTGIWGPGIVTNNGAVALWRLRNNPSAGAPDFTFNYGSPSTLPVPGEWVFPPLPLKAADGQQQGGPALDPAQLHPIIAAALDRLSAAGVSPANLAVLSQVTVETRTIGGGQLAESLPSLNRIYIDSTAAGHGWFVDSTPAQDEEFQHGQAPAGSAAAGREDLLTAVLHEMGNILGVGENNGSDVMAATLPTGTRRTEALDAVFASSNHG